ncbi:hypothetical protein IQ266_16150 [filamentous cyanobacterium LEGE 11480]|uniref:Uncharacterized protein n=1 Tax=Romeriopsis navalis LEGE 11480 TaxID=2777977 RepID=A0A928VRL2_9CYAN|nr:hypothetical protein [Romeriopsis navalis]MBE9031267.1 hypothetical protein [Romeriopsis navalis LEGE 11480]
MSSRLTPATCKRLLKLPQIPNVWEVDRRPLQQGSYSVDLGADAEGDCILWVDGSQGLVRAMDVVQPEVGYEAVVRTLLRAIEYPHDPGNPARPQKVVVRNRELQFYLRSVLQDLDISLEYVPDLPLIEEIFRSFEQVAHNRPPELPPAYAATLRQQAEQLWKLAPWEVLADHQILAITVNHWDLETVYASVMGMLGMEFGVLLYRSLDSLQQFRERAVIDQAKDGMEEAFLEQDCLFLTYEAATSAPSRQPAPFLRLLKPEMQPVFGNLHPLEGLRSFLYDEEAIAFSAILEGLCRFTKAHRHKFTDQQFPEISSRYKVPTLSEQHVTLKFATQPDLAQRLYELADDDEVVMPLIQDDLIPENSYLSLGMITWDMVSTARSGVKHHQPGQAKEGGDGLPVIVVQTTQPKAKQMMATIATMGGLKGVCFNPGSDLLLGEAYDLGLLQAENGELHLFGEFLNDDPMHQSARTKWDQRCRKTQGYCGLVIAKGMKGASRGNPKVTDMMALYEITSLPPETLGIGVLEKQSIPGLESLDLAELESLEDDPTR